MPPTGVEAMGVARLGWVVLLVVLFSGTGLWAKDVVSGTVSCSGKQAVVKSAVAQWDKSTGVLKVVLYDQSPPPSGITYAIELNFHFPDPAATTPDNLVLYVSGSVCPRGTFNDYRQGEKLRQDLLEFQLDPGRVRFKLKGQSRFEKERVAWDVAVDVPVQP
ncbi:MAG: hypothetical protein AB1758_19475 [Candidatus Eremiobacterota bacterium]